MICMIRSLWIVLLVSLSFSSPSWADAHQDDSQKSRTNELNATAVMLSDDELAWIKIHPEVTFAADPDFTPVEFFDETGAYVGIVADILQYVTEQTGLAFKVTQTENWQQSIELLKSGKIDMLPLLSNSGRTELPLLFTTSYLDYPSVILVRNDTQNISSLADLKGRKVVVVSEWSAEYDLKNNHPDIQVEAAPNSREAIDKLLFGQADAMIHYFPVASYELLQRGIGSVKIVGRTTEENGMMAVQKSLPHLHSIIQKVLNNLTDEKKQTIVSKWLNDGPPALEKNIDLTEEEKQYLKDNPTIKVAHDQDWKPFSYIKGEQSLGFSVEYVKLLFEAIGIDYEFVSGPWSDVYNKALAGEVDLILDLIRTQEREQKYFLYTPPYARNPNAIITKKSSDYASLESLKGKTVSFVAGSFLEEVLQDQDIKLSPRENSLDAFKALQFGEVDAVFSRVVIARRLINDNALFDLEIKSELDIGDSELDNMNIGVVKDKPLLHSILVKAMQHIDMQDVNELRQSILAVDPARTVNLNSKEVTSVMEKPTLSVGVINDSDQFTAQADRLALTSDLLNAIGKKVGVNFEYQNQGMLNGGFESFSNNELDIVIGNSELFAGSSAYTIKKPILTSYYAIAMKDRSEPITSLSDLTSEHMIGVVGPNQYIEHLNVTYPDVFFSKVLDEKAGLEELRKGSYDGLIADGLNLNHYIHENAWVDLDIALVTSKKIQYLMAFNQDVDTGVISALNKAQKGLSEEEYRNIFSENNTVAVVPNEGQMKQEELFSDSPIDSLLIIKAAIGVVVIIGALFLVPIILNKHMSNKTISQFNSNKLMVVVCGFIVAALVAVSIAAYVVIERVEQQTRHNIQISLSGITEAVNTSIDIWIDGRTSYVNSIASDPELMPMVRDLLKVKETKEEIKFSTVLIDLRVYFASHQARHGDRGFFIINKNRINVASMRNSNLGEVNVIQQQRPELLDRVFLGETVLVTPIASDLGAQSKDVDATMFVAAPIHNEMGEVIAAMTVRYDPAFEFSQIFSSGRVGQSGESYAFDDKGYFLSRSRFEDQLKESKALGMNANAILNLQMLKPDSIVSGGPNVNGLGNAMFLADEDKYTDAYLGAIRDTKGSSGEGYIDYRGVRVLGSWVWRENDQFGFVTEIDEEEALRGYISTRNLIVTLLSFTVLLTVGLTALSLWLGRRTQSVLMQSNEELERSVRERTLSLTSIIETAIDGIIVLDEDGDIAEFSPAAEAIFGYKKTEVLHAHIGMLLTPSEVSDEDFIVTPSVCKELEYFAKCKDGRLVAIEISAAEAHIGEQLFYTCIVRDITQRKAFQDALEMAKNEAEEATKSKSDFLANMSHEIRTPMNAIIGMSYLALQTELTRKQGDYVNKILAASNSLLGVINDILDFSKIEAGKLDIEQIPFTLESMMDNLSNIVTVKSQEKNLEFLISIEPEIPRNLIGDPLRIGQILLNLANNAVKFTEIGEIVVKVEAKKQSESSVVLLFSVQDSGIGMTGEQMARLFQAFSQADSSTTRQYGGTGLGLTISKNLVELMNGTIGCDSTPNEGSVFYFEIELDIDQTNSAKTPRLSQDYSGVKTLIVDDSEESRDILINLTRHLGLTADAVDTGMLALIQLSEADNQNEPYDLVLIDYKMPNMNGLDTVESLRKLNLSVEPRVVMVTAYGQDEIRNKAKNYDLDGFLVKPVSSSMLFDAISNAFDDNSSPDALANTKPSFDTELEDGVRGAEILLVEDNEVNQQVATELLELAQFRVTLASNGFEAVEILKERTFDLVLMDIQMPVMDGYLATETIRNELQLSELPIVAMTANAMASDKEKCTQVGMNDHVAKPIDPKVLFGVMNQWIESKERDLPQAIDIDENVVLPELEGFDVESAVARLGGRVQSYNKSLAMVNDSLANSIAEIGEALELQDVEQAVLTAHTVKGVSGNIGCTDLYQATSDLEDSLRSNPSDTVEGLLNRVESAASKALEVIGGYLLSITADDKQSKAFELNEVQALIEQLASEIDEFDISAAETCESLMGYLDDPDLNEIAKQLEQFISGYEFDEALEQLQLLSNMVSERES